MAQDVKSGEALARIMAEDAEREQGDRDRYVAAMERVIDNSAPRYFCDFCGFPVAATAYCCPRCGWKVSASENGNPASTDPQARVARSVDS